MRVRVLSLNTWGLPLGLARDLPARTEALGEALARSDADAVALQEVWTPRARQALRERAASAGLGHAFSMDRATGDSGLTVLSRWPFALGDSGRFRVRGRAERIDHGDYWAGKGWLDLVLDTPRGPIRLVDTHLHAAYADGGRRDRYAGERMAQAVELAHAVRGRDAPLLVVGDFNMHEGSDEYEVWRALSATTDVAAALDARAPTIEADHLYQHDHSEDQRIDYAFVRDGAEAGLRPVAIERAFDAPIDLGGREGRYSDHHGLQIDLELVPGAAAASERPAGSAPPPAALLALARERLETAAARTESRGRRQTRAGLAGLVGAGAIGLAADLRTRDRRALLRALALGVPALGALASGLMVAVGSGFTEAEAARFDDVARLLRDFEAD